MAGAISIGTTGLAAASKELDVIGNNLANSNTLGFKSGGIYFSSMLNQSLTSGASNTQVGQGVSVLAIQNQFTQGSFDTTSSGTDLAIDGEGFFIVTDTDGTRYYTRAGAFVLDKDGYMVDTKGYRVQGHIITNGVESTTLSDLQLGSLQSAPVATTTISIAANLNANAAIGDTYQTSQTVYDSLGNDHELTVTYTKSATTGQWIPTATLTKTGAAGTVTATLTLTPTGAASPLTFDSTGALTSPAQYTFNTSGFTYPGGATFADVTWNLSGADHLDVTQYASTSVTKQLYVDGYPSGSLKNISIDKSGIVSGYFTNGQTQDIARVMLASFPSNVGLAKIGNYFVQSFSSGQAVYNNPDSAGLGSIKSSTLETSNVDTATEFMNMISAQRMYQANAKVITTADAMLSTLMSIKQ
ncbi:MAG: Flagellar hook protein FlgE [Syntrophus sp. SKADARSKE-3]|nr:Flagellar hook protein FlgE [Syntrophus sp. SKADARSKE-3]